MNSSSYIINVTNPCSKDWNQMVRQGQGRYCSQCEKTVTDFTNLTDREIVNLLEQSAGKICGRLSNQQLNRVISVPNSKSYSSLFNRIFSGILLLLGTTYQTKAEVLLSTPFTNISSVEEYTQNELEEKDNNPPIDSLNYVEGIVRSQTGEPLIATSVGIKNTSISMVTDLDGMFKLYIPDTLIVDTIIVYVKTAFSNEEIVINRKSLPIRKDIVIIQLEDQLQGVFLGGMSVKKKRWWHFRRNWRNR